MILAFLFGLVSLSFFDVDFVLLYLLVVMAVGALPDLDHENSKLGRRIKPLSWLLNTFLGHRGIVHSIFPIILAYLFFAYYLDLVWVGVAFSVGYFSHLVGDAFTYGGIAFLHPITSFRVRGFIKTGGFLEEILFFVFLVLSCVQIYRLLMF